jgi:parallel beta-helix repeat protein
MRLTIFSLLTLMGVVACRPATDATAPTQRTPASPNATVSTDAACGASIVEDLRLEEDLTCVGDGLIVNADRVKINLNGHTISGNGTGNGITVRNRTDVSIYGGGTISGFITGILVATSTDVVIKDNGFTANREAIFLNGSSGNTVKNNVAWQNTQRGIMVRPTGAGIISTDNVVMDNVLTANPSGILLFGQPGNMIKANTITGSTVGALDLTGGGASGNVFKNNLLANSAAGIKFGAGWTGNTFLDNTIQSNTCGTQGPSANNTFIENRFVGNTTDVCP